jgi:starch-binding outer membrane protein, SusD/RagB family
MKKLLYNILVSAVLLFSAASCEDVLDKQAVDTFNEGLVFSDINVVKAYLGKTYDRMGGDTDAGILGGREDLLSSGTDQTLCIHRPANYVMIKGTMSPDQLGIFVNNGLGGYLRWNNLYANIQNVNRILGNIDAVPTSTSTEENLKKQIKGEAYFIRAYDYAVLMMLYGGSILQDTPFKLGEDYNSINRSSIRETLDFILSDINLALENLPATIEQGRANRGAAAALKSRVLLFAASKLTNGGYEANNPLVSFPAGSQAALLQQARDAAKGCHGWKLWQLCPCRINR